MVTFFLMMGTIMVVTKVEFLNMNDFSIEC